MKNIQTSFRDDQDKMIAIVIVISSLFLFIFPSLLAVLFGKKYISPASYEISKAFFNCELMLLLISLICIIPIIGWLLGIFLTPLLILYNIIVVIISLCAIANKPEVKIPVWYEFI